MIHSEYLEQDPRNHTDAPPQKKQCNKNITTTIEQKRKE